jgi:hypothetical protein
MNIECYLDRGQGCLGNPSASGGGVYDMET